MSVLSRPSFFQKMALSLSAVFALSLNNGSEASADICKKIDRMSVRIERKTERLVRELNHYRHTPQYAHLVQDTLEMRNAARHIHDVSHFEGNLTHLQADLACLDRSFHHLEDLFYQVECAAERGHGHIHGNTRHVRNQLKSLERDIHRLQDLVSEVQPVVAPVLTPTIQYRSYRSSTGGYGQGFHHNSRGVHASHGVHSGRSVHASHGINNARGVHSSQGINSYRFQANPFQANRGFSVGGGSSRMWFPF